MAEKDRKVRLKRVSFFLHPEKDADLVEFLEDIWGARGWVIKRALRLYIKEKLEREKPGEESKPLSFEGVLGEDE